MRKRLADWMRTFQGRLFFACLLAAELGLMIALRLWLAAALAAYLLVDDLRGFSEWWERDRAKATTEAAQMGAATQAWMTGVESRVFNQDD